MSNPFMQLYVADYLGDTRHLTTEQHGAYLLLLMTMWRADGVLPNDDKKLARIVGCTSSRWARIKAEVLEFFDVDRGELTNPRLRLELKKASEKSNQRAEAGSRGGKAKALKTNKMEVANATDLLCHSSEPEPDTKEASAPLVVPRHAALSKAEVTRGFAGFWESYPRKVGKDAASKAYDRAIRRIGGAQAVETIIDGLCRALPGWDDPDFIPHPTTWLNQGRWEDEAPAPRSESRHDRSANQNRTAAFAQPSRAERDQSAALEVLARRGALPRQDLGWDIHDLRPSGA